MEIGKWEESNKQSFVQGKIKSFSVGLALTEWRICFTSEPIFRGIQWRNCSSTETDKNKPLYWLNTWRKLQNQRCVIAKPGYNWIFIILVLFYRKHFPSTPTCWVRQRWHPICSFERKMNKQYYYDPIQTLTIPRNSTKINWRIKRSTKNRQQLSVTVRARIGCREKSSITKRAHVKKCSSCVWLTVPSWTRRARPTSGIALACSRSAIITRTSWAVVFATASRRRRR